MNYVINCKSSIIFNVWETSVVSYKFFIYRLFFLSVLLSYGGLPLLCAQVQLGFHLQQHSGINGAVLNPARTATYPYRWDINLVGLNVFIANDYGYLEQTSLLRLLQDPPEVKNFYVRSEIGERTKLPANAYVADFYDLRSKGYVVFSTDIMGPSFSFKINAMHSIGFFSRARTWAGTQNIPVGLSYYNFYNKPFFEEIPLSPFLLNALAWTEIGLNYSLRLPVANGSLAIGISVKSLNGYEALYFQSEKRFNIVKIENDSITGADFNLSGAITTSNLKNGDYQIQSAGKGVGVDLGIVYNIEDNEGNYIWQFGFSLLDIGRLSFSGDAEQHRVVSTQSASLGASDYSDISGLADVPGKIRLFSSQTLGDPNASLEGNSFSLWLPTAFSLQADHHFGNGWYTSAVFMQGIPMDKQSPHRGSLLAVAPRIEKRWYALSLPLSIYNWDLMRIGLATRLGFLTVGTDDLGSWLIRKKLSNADVYVAIKVPFFQLSPGGDGNMRMGKKGKGNMDCYQF